MKLTHKITYTLTATLLSTGLVTGETFDNDSGDGTWENAANWNPDTVPAGGNNAIIGDGHVVSLSSNQALNEFDIAGDNTTGNATLNHTAGTVTGGGWFKVGLGAGDTGNLNMSGNASVSGHSNLYIGRDGGTGNVSLSGNSSFTVGGPALVASNTGSTGNLTISDSASLSVTYLRTAGTGTVNQSGGSVTTSQWLSIGNGDTGTYNHTGGTVSVNTDDALTIGESSTGVYNLSGTAVVTATAATATRGVIIGRNSGADGTLNITGSTASITASDLRIGVDSSDSPQAPGTINFTADGGGITTFNSTGTTILGLNNATLGVDLSVFPQLIPADITLVDNQGAAATGTFVGLPEGAVVPGTGGGTITYVGGADGFDIVIQNALIPEPSSFLLLGLGSLAFLRRRR